MNYSNQHLKIFISSTFEDMNQEREDLLKDIFLHIKKEAKKRDVEITEIDLRWGVDEDSSSKGQTVKVCLDEIQRCKDSPIFFIGVLGNRYGWDKWFETLDKSILEDTSYNWIEEYKDRSITELEIQSALKEQNSHALFFLKKPLKDEETKLRDLKKKIKDESLKRANIFTEDYDKTKDLKEKILDKFITLLDELFPIAQTKTEVEKLREYHYQFAKSRQKVYIQHKINESIISKFLKSHEDRLLIYGDSGLGKSALISNYFKNYKEQNKNTLVVEHYIGGAGELSNDIYHILKRVMMEIKEYFQIEDEIPNDNDSIINDFALWLDKVTSPMVIVLDGYNQIEDNIKEKLFYYLPDKLKNIKLIITSIKDNHPIENRYKIEKLSKDEQQDLIVSYLVNYGKKLEANILENILSHSQVENTLFLKTLLDEIRLLGSYEKLSSLIDEYLKTKTPVELFDKIFERFENDYEKNTPNLTKDILSLLYVSRDGLSETNLTEILKLNRLDFSPLFLALEEHLINKNGLYGFFHDYIKEAVESRYLDQKKINDYRIDIADYFEVREIDSQRVRELPYHLYLLKDKKGLYNCLKNIDFFIESQIDDEYELLKYIKFIDLEYKIIEELKSSIINDTYTYTYTYATDINFFGYFLQSLYGRYEDALLIHQKLLYLHIQENGEYSSEVAISYNQLATVNIEMGNFKESIYLLKNAIKIREKLFLNDEELSTLYHNLAKVYERTGNYDNVIFHYEKSLNIRKKLFHENHIKVAESYGNLGSFYTEIGEYKLAYPFIMKSIEIREKLFGKKHFKTSIAYHMLSSLFQDLGKINEAYEYLTQVLEIRKSTLGEEHPSTIDIYSDLANIFHKIGEYLKAKELFSYVLDKRKKVLGIKHIDTAQSFHNLAISHRINGEYNMALELFKHALEIRELLLGKNHIGIATTYNSLGVVFHAMEDYEQAIFYYQKALDIRKNVLNKNHPSIAMSYKNLGSLCLFSNKVSLDYGCELLNKALDIEINILDENSSELARTYNLLSHICREKKLIKEAISYMEKSISILEKTFNKEHPQLINSNETLRNLKLL